MSLFVMNRYEGDEEEEDNKVQNEDHLAVLKRKIEERKRKRAKTESKPDSSAKHSLSETNSDTVPQNILPQKPSDETTDEPKKKKKKKNKVKETLPENENEQSENQTEEPKSAQSGKPKDCGFTILSTGKQFKVKSVRRVLPKWLAQPNIIPSDLESGPSLDENSCGLDSQFISALKSNGVERLFPVQSSVVPWLLECNEQRKRGIWVRDTCICAPTGSGKTLVYILPILQILKGRFVRRVRCLIVLPVQELAAQVFKVLQTYATETNLDIGLISGACSFEEEQKKILRKRSNGEYLSLVDILVATPGRLVDHIEKTEGFSLDHLQFLVIDEADRATDWLQHIPSPHSKPPPLTMDNMTSCKVPPAQKILLSATLSQDPEKISRLGLFRPVLFTTVAFTKDEDIDLDKLQEESMARFSIPEKLSVRVVESSAEYKPLAVVHILTKCENVGKTLVFTNSGNSAHRLSILLHIMLQDKGIIVKELSSQLTPKQREETLTKFAEGQFQILVCSDALARGLDIPGVTMVISYDPPKYIKGFVHRIGRTGRAGTPGTAISVITPNQLEFFTQMLKSSHMTVPEIEKQDLEPLAESVDYPSHLEKLKEMLESEQAKALKKVKAIKAGH